MSPAPARARFIAFEGGEACGKSTQAALLADALDAVLTHEPGATPLGRELRQLLLDPATGAVEPRAEALLMAAAHYRVPLLLNVARKRGVFYIDALYGSLFTEVGNAWNYGETQNCRQVPAGTPTDCSDGNTLLEDVGAELRLKAFLFNDFNPWNSVARVAYGFQDNADYGFSDDDLPLRLYFGLGTNF